MCAKNNRESRCYSAQEKFSILVQLNETIKALLHFSVCPLGGEVAFHVISMERAP